MPLSNEVKNESSFLVGGLLAISPEITAALTEVFLREKLNLPDDKHLFATKSKLKSPEIILFALYKTEIVEGEIEVRPIKKLSPTKKNKNYTFRCVRVDTGAEILKPKRASDLHFVKAL